MSKEKRKKDIKTVPTKEESFKKMIYLEGIILKDIETLETTMDSFVRASLMNIFHYGLFGNSGFLREYYQQLHEIGLSAFKKFVNFEFTDYLTFFDDYYKKYKASLRHFCESEQFDSCLEQFRHIPFDQLKQNALFKEIDQNIENMLTYMEKNNFKIISDYRSFSIVIIHQHLEMLRRMYAADNRFMQNMKFIVSLIMNVPIFTVLLKPTSFVKKHVVMPGIYSASKYLHWHETSKSINVLTEKELEDYVQTFENHQKKIAAVKDVVQNTARVFSMIILCLFISELLAGRDNIYPGLCLAFAYKWLVELLKNAAGWNTKKNDLANILKISETSYKILLENQKADIDFIQGKCLETSLVTLNFLKQTKNLPAIKLAKIMEYCLISCDVFLLGRSGSQLILGAKPLTNEIRDKVRTLFENNCKAEKNIRKLKAVIYNIFSGGNRIYCIPSYDENNLAVIEMVIVLSVADYQKLNEKLKHAFNHNGNILSVHKSEEEVTISIKGCSLPDKRKVEDLCTEIRKLRANNVPLSRENSGGATSSVDFPQTDSDNTGSSHRSTPKRDAKPSSTPTTVVANNRLIQWQSTQYQFGSNKKQVHPILRSHYLPAYRRFTLWRIGRSQFRTDEEFNKTKTIVENPVIVPNKYSQGLVHTKAVKQDPITKKWFKCSLKAKIKGEYGDIRAYAEDEISPTGETVSVFKVVELSSHTGMKM